MKRTQLKNGHRYISSSGTTQGVYIVGQSKFAGLLVSLEVAPNAMQWFQLSRLSEAPPEPLKIIRPWEAKIYGAPMMLGTCCMCGRKLYRSNVTKIGAKCPEDGAQYDRSTGELLYHAATPLQRYRVTETVVYEVEARYEGEACLKIEKNKHRDKLCVEVADRVAELSNSQ